MELQSTGLTKEAQQLKELYQEEIAKLSSLTDSRTERNLTEDEARDFLRTFSSQTVNMLKSYGFTEKDWAKFEGPEDPRFIFMGFLFLAVADSNTGTQSFSFVKSRAMEDGDNGSCWNFENVKDCLLYAVGADVIFDVYDLLKGAGECLSKKTVKEAIETIAKKYVGSVVSVAWAIYDFSTCMGDKG